jgi:hypothetical protein
VAALLLLATACGGGPAGPAGESDRGEAGHGEEGHADAVTAPVEEVVDHRVAVPPGGVAVVTLPAFGIHDVVTFRRLRVLTESGEVELLRAAFTDATPGARCAASWPVPEPPGEDPFEDMELDEGDASPLVLYLRPRGGTAVVDEARVSYEVDGGPGELTWRGFRIEIRRTPGARCR